MSAFRVYGVSKTICRQRAEKATPAYDGALKRMLTDDEWTARVKARADELFAQGGARAISPVFSAPQFCQDWIRLAGDSVRACVIKARVETGTKKNGMPRFGWRPYQADQQQSRRRKSHPARRRAA